MSFNSGSPYSRELEQLNSLRDTVLGWFAGRRSLMYLAVLLVFLVLWLMSGVYVVQPGEEGVERTFGKFSSITASGLNYRIPWPIQTVTVVDVASIRRAEVGFRTARDGKREVLNEALMLTEDENIVQVELLIQYRIGSSRDFVFNVQEPEATLLGSTEVALRSTVGQMNIDAVITEERARVQDETRIFLAKLMEDYGTGILITDVRLQVADPPSAVRDAFQEVVRAKADKERLINEAEAYQNDVVPRARGEAQRLIEEASAFKEERVLLATGDAQRFLSVLESYSMAPEVTRERMHIEALEAVLSHVKLILLDEKTVGGQLLPFLPLTELGATTNSPSPALPTTEGE